MYGFIRVATATPVVDVANIEKNTAEMILCAELAEKAAVDVLFFPELGITGYTCADLFAQDLLINTSEDALQQYLKVTEKYSFISIVGIPVRLDGQLYNCAAILYQGKIYGIVPKEAIPNAGEFYEKRWFTASNEAVSEEILYANQVVPFSHNLLFPCPNRGNLTIGVEICEDLWIPNPPSIEHALAGATLLCNLSASNDLVSKADYRKLLISAHSAKLISAYAYCSAGMGESSTDLVFGGHSMIAENGSILSESPRFSLENQLTIADIDVDKLANLRRQSTDFMTSRSNQEIREQYRYIPIPLQDRSTFSFIKKIEKNPFVPNNTATLSDHCNEIISIQSAGLAKRLKHVHAKSAVIAISGGLDSTLALLSTVHAIDFLEFDRKTILGITMPGFGTTDRTYQNALDLMKSLGISTKEISIKASVLQHFQDIDQDPENHDVTYENAQARERMQIIMDIANQTDGLVIGTGDLSELALGFTTYNGDHMSMYGINAGIPKTLVRVLVDWYSKQPSFTGQSAEILQDILQTPVSPELLPPSDTGTILQKTEEVVGPYELTDFFLYYFIRFGFTPSKILFLAENAFSDEYTRSEILYWMKSFFKRFFSQQFKRSCIPDGPKVGTISLSPRGDWRMPSDASASLWISEIEKLEKSTD